ncbi:MAG: hypothetical protein ACK5TN_11185 [Acidobacteriota bacterium]
MRHLLLSGQSAQHQERFDRCLRIWGEAEAHKLPVCLRRLQSKRNPAIGLLAGLHKFRSLTGNDGEVSNGSCAKLARGTTSQLVARKGD